MSPATAAPARSCSATSSAGYQPAATACSTPTVSGTNAPTPLIYMAATSSRGLLGAELFGAVDSPHHRGHGVHIAEVRRVDLLGRYSHPQLAADEAEQPRR